MLYRILGYRKPERDTLHRTWTEAYRAHRRQTWAIFWAFALGFWALLWALLKAVGL